MIGEEKVIHTDSVTEETLSAYAVKLPVFEGPLELLLHLIKKHEIDIYDIPISLITRQYLEYLDLMKSLDLNVVGEFLVVAATLIHIKCKMLLPPSEIDEGEEEDPRNELVRRLVEYRRFSEAAQQLEQKEVQWRDIFCRLPIPIENVQEEIQLSDLNLFDLLEVLKAVFERVPTQRSMEILVDQLSVQDRMSIILDNLEKQQSMSFSSLFEHDQTRISIIVTFLALLELIRLRLVQVIQAELLGAIRIWRRAG